jgi:hypothetical protein
MKTLRSVQAHRLVPTATALTLLLGTALLTRTIRTESSQTRQVITELVLDEAPATEQCTQIAALLEQGRFSEADELLVALPSMPLRLDAAPDTEAFRLQSQTFLRLGRALIQSAIRQSIEGKKEQALGQVRLCRALARNQVSSPQAEALSQKLLRMVDTTEARLRRA